jgi:hypothetical protein
LLPVERNGGFVVKYMGEGVLARRLKCSTRQRGDGAAKAIQSIAVRCSGRAAMAMTALCL